MFAFLESFDNFIHGYIVKIVIKLVMFYCYAFTSRLSRRCMISLPVLFFGMVFISEPIKLILIKGTLPYFSFSFSCCVAFLISECIRVLITKIIISFGEMPVLKRQKRIPVCLLSIPTINVVSCCVVIQIENYLNVIEESYLCLLITTILLLLNLTVFRSVDKISNLVQEMSRQDFFLENINLKEQYYQEIENNYKDIQKLRHDIKNQMLGLMACLENPELLRDEIEEIIGGLRLNGLKRYTENEVVNLILNRKVAEAENLNIKVECIVLLPVNVQVPSQDAGIIFGNLLDNAIEACDRKKESDKWINIKIIYKNKMLFCEIVNSKEKMEKSNINSSIKKDSEKHGIGTKSVRNIIDKYNGSIDFTDREVKFEVRFVLYNIEEIDLSVVKTTRKGSLYN